MALTHIEHPVRRANPLFVDLQRPLDMRRAKGHNAVDDAHDMVLVAPADSMSVVFHPSSLDKQPVVITAIDMGSVRAAPDKSIGQTSTLR